jgi:tetrahydromethanopterin S-methyltransferase subunit G
MSAIVEQMRREASAAAEASEALSGARYDEILRRLDRIERRLDTTP